MLRFTRWFLVSMVILFLTACGGGGSGSSGGGNVPGDNGGGNPNNPNNQPQTETYTDCHGDIVPVQGEKPAIDAVGAPKDIIYIWIDRHINLESGVAAQALSMCRENENNEYYDGLDPVAINIDVKCEDYGFDQGDLGTEALLNGVQWKHYVRSGTDTTGTSSCIESDYESAPSYLQASGQYTIIASKTMHLQ